MRFSVIVPSYNTGNTIIKCLQSVSDQSHADFECIVVEDCSKDGSKELIEDFLKKDRRFRLICNQTNIGLGRARNKGVQNASGDYLLFLDSDDWIDCNTLSTLETLVRKRPFDIVFFDHFLAYQEGKCVTANQSRLFLEEYDKAPGHIQQISRIFHVAWNKAYRREFFCRNQLLYPQGSYEDFVVTYKALVFAGSIGFCKQPLYYYRQRTGTKVMQPNAKPNSVDHGIVFERYDELFSFLESSDRGLRWHAVIYAKMINQMAAIYGYRLVGEERTEFGRKALDIAKRYKPEHPVYFSKKDRILMFLFDKRMIRFLPILQSLNGIVLGIRH